jgi:hypothetical protein
MPAPLVIATALGLALKKGIDIYRSRGQQQAPEIDPLTAEKIREARAKADLAEGKVGEARRIAPLAFTPPDPTQDPTGFARELELGVDQEIRNKEAEAPFRLDLERKARDEERERVADVKTAETDSALKQLQLDIDTALKDTNIEAKQVALETAIANLNKIQATTSSTLLDVEKKARELEGAPTKDFGEEVRKRMIQLKGVTELGGVRIDKDQHSRIAEIAVVDNVPLDVAALDVVGSDTWISIIQDEEIAPIIQKTGVETHSRIADDKPPGSAITEEELPATGLLGNTLNRVSHELGQPVLFIGLEHIPFAIEDAVKILFQGGVTDPGIVHDIIRRTLEMDLFGAVKGGGPPVPFGVKLGNFLDSDPINMPKFGPLPAVANPRQSPPRPPSRGRR